MGAKSQKPCILFSQPSDKKSAESARPNLIWATAGGEREEEELEEDGHADAQTRGPGNVLSMFLWACHAAMQVAETLCQHLSLLDSENGRKEQRRREKFGFVRERSGRNGRMDKESWKRTNELKQRRNKIYWKMNWGMDGHSRWVWCCGPLCAPIDSVSPVLQLFVLCSVQVLRRKYFCFLSFYCFII